MGASRTSNKDVLNGIEDLAGKIDSLVNVLTQTAMQSATPAQPAATTVQPKADEETSVNVDPAYLAHMQGKAAAHATDKGQDVVLYSRRNKRGEVKLAYALLTRYESVIKKQPSYIGAHALYKPAS